LSDCNDTKGILYQLWFSHTFLNNDNEKVPRTLHYQSRNLNELWALEVVPIKYMASQSVWSRQSAFETSYHFMNEYPERRPVLDAPKTLQIVAKSSDQQQLWTTVKVAPKGMRFLALELGAFFGFFLFFAIILRAINSIFFRQELSDKVFDKLHYSKYSPEDVISYEEMIRLKFFLSKLKQNKEIKKLLKNDPETANLLSDDENNLNNIGTIPKSTMSSEVDVLELQSEAGQSTGSASRAVKSVRSHLLSKTALVNTKAISFNKSYTNTKAISFNKSHTFSINK